ATAGSAAIWIEGVRVRTRPALDLAAMRERSDATGMLVRAIVDADAADFAAVMQDYCCGLLDKAAGLRAALGAEHPAVPAAAGTVQAELLERAKNLLLARLAER
ncbi:MAG TPA: hypothetical protein VFW75_03920, partial [Acetobacteraceae bacterium]|nr:hypothetical protein [Acetobacteraceae bacterium]